jgi:plasmid stabilization system protein ParE
VAALRPLSLHYSARARRQLLAILDYVSGETGREVAADIADGIHDAAELLRYFPYAGRAGRVANTREWVVRRFPYVIVYQIDPGVVTILGIFHTRQERR